MNNNRLRIFLLGVSVCISMVNYSMQYGDIVISEVMVDAEPVVSDTLPEYVELFNRSDNPITLSNWSIMFGEKPYLLPSFILQPDSFVVLCSKSMSSLFHNGIRLVGLNSFPTLLNSKGFLALISDQNEVVFCLNYSENWYGSPFKADGGWSLECKDPTNVSGKSENWTASTNPNGGTPGFENSVRAVLADNTPARCQRILIRNSSTIELIYDKALKIETVHEISSVNISPEKAIVLSANLSFPDLKTVRVTLSDTLEAGILYEVSVSGLRDVSNLLLHDTVLKVGLPETPFSNSLRINEVLFNPKPGGCDYVEFMNIDSRWIDLSKVLLSSRLDNGVLSKAFRITDQSIPCEPGSIWLLSVSTKDVCASGPFPQMPNFLDMDGFPSFADEEGRVVLITSNGVVLDEMHYSNTMHYVLLSNENGVSLERRNPFFDSGSSSAWVSASSSANYGTPGFKNSQFVELKMPDETGFVADQYWLSPNNDGKDDALSLNYHVEDQCQATLLIFDSKGRKVKTLAQNVLLGATGQFCWDGTSDSNSVVPFGRYILFIEAYSPSGKVHRQKMVLSVLF